MSKLPHLIFLFIIGLQTVININALTCYVCGPEKDITCNSFDPRNSTFIQHCPPNSKSCSRISQENMVSRSCEENKINDCQTANRVEYCYCLKDNCNGEFLDTTDDEDLLEEGSGTSKITVNHATTTISPKKNHASIIQINYISILICLMNSII